MSVTRKQVAKFAGVSEATVSYVVNNGPRPVAAETRERVREAIRVLGYHPSDVARSLRMQRTSTFGLVVPDTANPFYGEIARIIENVGYENGYTVLLCNSNGDSEREINYINTLRSKRVAGVVIIPTEPSAVTYLLDANIPTVVMEHDIPGAYCLIADDFGGGVAVAKHLLELGHTHIEILARDGDTSNSTKRADGIGYTLRWKGQTPPASASIPKTFSPGADPNHVRAMSDTEYGSVYTSDILSRDTTAIIAHNDSMALGVMAAIRRNGLRIPQDVSVVGFDDIAEAAYIDPPLTTVAHPKLAMGEQAARLLIDLVLGKETAPPNTITFEMKLVVRGSTAPPPKRI